jgi:hypothetical protein
MLDLAGEPPEPGEVERLLKFIMGDDWRCEGDPDGEYCIEDCDC